MDITHSPSEDSILDFSYDSCDASSFLPFISNINILEDELYYICSDIASTPYIEDRVISSESYLKPPQLSNSDATHVACKTYSLMGSDTNVRLCYKQIDYQGESLHYFHCLAITDRISQLSTTPQHTCIKSPKNCIAAIL